jgi:hypothetical protein
LFDGYELKLNSYDLGVDIELADVIQRLRFEHPEVKTVVMASGKDKVFCAGANIRMLGGAAHSHKVNFCKFTNETRNSIEDATTTPTRPGCVQYRARVRAADTNWRWRATRSFSPMTARPRWRCRKCRCWPCCRALAG